MVARPGQLFRLKTVYIKIICLVGVGVWQVFVQSLAQKRAQRPRLGKRCISQRRSVREIEPTALSNIYKNMANPKPYEFIGFGAMAVTKPYQFIGFGAMAVTKPY